MWARESSEYISEYQKPYLNIMYLNYLEVSSNTWWLTQLYTWQHSCLTYPSPRALKWSYTTHCISIVTLYHQSYDTRMRTSFTIFLCKSQKTLNVICQKFVNKYDAMTESQQRTQKLKMQKKKILSILWYKLYKVQYVNISSGNHGNPGTGLGMRLVQD